TRAAGGWGVAGGRAWRPGRGAGQGSGAGLRRRPWGLWPGHLAWKVVRRVLPQPGRRARLLADRLLVAAVAPDHRGAADDGGEAVAEDERVPGTVAAGGELADHVFGPDRLPGVVVPGAFAGGHQPGQFAGHLQRLRDGGAR